MTSLEFSGQDGQYCWMPTRQSRTVGLFWWHETVISNDADLVYLSILQYFICLYYNLI